MIGHESADVRSDPIPHHEPIHSSYPTPIAKLSTTAAQILPPTTIILNRIQDYHGIPLPGYSLNVTCESSVPVKPLERPSDRSKESFLVSCFDSTSLIVSMVVIVESELYSLSTAIGPHSILSSLQKKRLTNPVPQQSSVSVIDRATHSLLEYKSI